MKAVKVKTKELDYTRPGEPLTQEEFEAIIRKAEAGPFMTHEEYKAKFEAWKKSLKS